MNDIVSIAKAARQSQVYDDPLTAILACNGNLALAAERLNVSQATLLQQLAIDPTTQSVLPLQLKTIAILYIFELITQVKIAFESSIPDLTPYEAAKTLTSMLTLLNSMSTSATPGTFNIQDALLKMLPPEAREAMFVLSAS